MTLEDSLFRLRDSRIKQQMLYPACCVCSLVCDTKSDYLFCHNNAKVKL